MVKLGEILYCMLTYVSCVISKSMLSIEEKIIKRNEANNDKNQKEILHISMTL